MAARVPQTENPDVEKTTDFGFWIWHDGQSTMAPWRSRLQRRATCWLHNSTPPMCVTDTLEACTLDYRNKLALYDEVPHDHSHRPSAGARTAMDKKGFAR